MKIRSSGGALLVSAALVLVTGGALAAPEIGAYTGKISPTFDRAKGATLLYNQNSNSAGITIDSQNFTSGLNASYNDAAADDFVVPKGQAWTVTQVDVTGTYFVGSGPAASENVTFYKDKKKVPGKAVRGGTFSDLSCADNSGSFSCSLGKGVKLKAGHYWVSVVANCSGKICGEWGWELNSTVHNAPAVWENAGEFGVCFTWESIVNCGLGYNTDLMFDLQGTTNK